MTAAAIILGVVVALLLVERLQERRHANPDVAKLIGLCDRLCQRLQAPSAAILEHDEQVRQRRDEEYAPPAVTPDDDDAFWMSREKLAELAMQQEMSGGRPD